MGFGAGHIADMNNRLKQNRAQRPSKRAKFKEKNREAIHAPETIAEMPQFKSVSETVLNDLKNTIRIRAQKDQKKERSLNGILLVFGLIFLIGFLKWLQ